MCLEIRGLLGNWVSDLHGFRCHGIFKLQTQIVGQSTECLLPEGVWVVKHNMAPNEFLKFDKSTVKFKRTWIIQV